MNKKYTFLFISILTALGCQENEEQLNIELTLVSNEWIADKYKMPQEDNFDSYGPFKNIYNFYENGTYKIRKPHTKFPPFEIDTTEVFGQWTLDRINSIIKISGTDTWVIGPDTLTFDRSDWKILELTKSTIKVENLKDDGKSTEYIEIFTAK